MANFKWLQNIAEGDWSEAVLAASIEMQWSGCNIEELERFVHDLSGYPQSAQEIAINLLPFATLGQLQIDTVCFAPHQWCWLLLVARGSFEEALECAHNFFGAEVNYVFLESALRAVAGGHQGDLQVLAASTYSEAVLGNLHRETFYSLWAAEDQPGRKRVGFSGEVEIFESAGDSYVEAVYDRRQMLARNTSSKRMTFRSSRRPSDPTRIMT
ncbi:hypothetical protein AB0D66_34505 [Streptomyces sp. NPDC048270]|uniref:hypothetical protein n=1 Tax=Streptomyces sp. NPDC048270 TaxID=3154615 RepID=UPI0033CCED35